MRAWMIPAALLLGGCSDEMGILEALSALGEIDRSAQGERATAGVIEVSTDFTIGGALADAAQTIADFWESQAPCTEVSVEGAAATIDYGTLDDACVWNGKTYAGINTIEVSSTTPGELQVEHGWEGFNDGGVSLDGDAVVTWSGSDLTRRVVTDHSFTELSGEGGQIDVHGDHISGRIDEDVPVWQSGFTLEGIREWTSDGKQWSLTMTDLELMLIDPAPQAGSVDVTAPSGKTLTVVYDRVDEDTVSATLVGLRGGDRVYHISRLGAVSEAP